MRRAIDTTSTSPSPSTSLSPSPHTLLPSYPSRSSAVTRTKSQEDSAVSHAVNRPPSEPLSPVTDKDKTEKTTSPRDSRDYDPEKARLKERSRSTHSDITGGVAAIVNKPAGSGTAPEKPTAFTVLLTGSTKKSSFYVPTQLLSTLLQNVCNARNLEVHMLFSSPLPRFTFIMFLVARLLDESS